jgi:hypothetical protein
VLAVTELASNVLWAAQSDPAVKRAIDDLLSGTVELAEPAAVDGLFVLGDQVGTIPPGRSQRRTPHLCTERPPCWWPAQRTDGASSMSGVPEALLQCSPPAAGPVHMDGWPRKPARAPQPRGIARAGRDSRRRRIHRGPGAGLDQDPFVALGYSAAPSLNDAPFRTNSCRP